MISEALDRRLRWIIHGTMLTFVLYLPVWYFVGAYYYGNTHPDFWHGMTPAFVIPFSACISSTIIIAIRLVFFRK